MDENHDSIEIFLTDFGLACSDFSEYRNKTITHIPGTPLYFASEKLRGEVPPEPRVGDVYAAEVSLLELVS